MTVYVTHTIKICADLGIVHIAHLIEGTKVLAS